MTMRTELEIAHAVAVLALAKENALRAHNSDAPVLSLFVDLLKWVQGEPSAFGPQLDIIRKRIASGIN